MADIINNLEKVGQASDNQTLPLISNILKDHSDKQHEFVKTFASNNERILDLKVRNADLKKDLEVANSDEYLISTRKDVFNNIVSRTLVNINSKQAKILANKTKDNLIDELSEKVDVLKAENTRLKINKEEAASNQAVLIANLRNDLNESRNRLRITKDEVKVERESLISEYKLAMRENKADYKDQLNNLIIRMNTIQTELNIFYDKITKNPILRLFGKRTKSILDSIRNTKWFVRDLLTV